MKKMMLVAVAALLMAAPAVQAQKVNREAILAKIEKSNAEIADAKKGAKAATWLNRAKVFYDAAVEPTKSLYVGMETMMLPLAVGEPKSKGKAELNGKQYEAWTYNYFIVYLSEGKVATWKQTKHVAPNGFEKAIEAYTKAYELDAKMQQKASDGLKQVSNYCAQIGNAGLDSGDYAAASKAYEMSFKAQSSPAFMDKVDPSLLFYAGYLQAVMGPEKPEAYVKGAENLAKAIEMDYVDEEGNIYYYLFHCYYGQKDADKAFIAKSKDVLLAGMEKFPKNSRIIESLIQLYTVEEGMGDPADLVAKIDGLLVEQPNNVDLWFGRGRVFYALKNYDESINSFKKVTELAPDMYEGNYFLGVFYTYKGEEALSAVNAKQYTGQAEYDKDLNAVNEYYKAALPWFEKAHELKPGDVNSLELMKSICFRFRDEAPEYMQKYEKYNELFKQAKGQ